MERIDSSDRDSLRSTLERIKLGLSIRPQGEGLPGEYPTAAFALALVAAGFHAIGGFLVASVFAFVAVFVGPLSLLGTALAMIFVVLAFLGAYWLYTGQKQRVIHGGVLTLLVVLLAFPTGWGLIIGSFLGLIAGILGLVWQSSTPSSPWITPPTGPS